MGTYVPVTKASLGLGNVDNTSDATKNSAAAALTNKTIDATNNTISNIAVSNMAASAVVTASETIGSNNNDTTIPTSAAVKSYVDGNSSAWAQVLKTNLNNTVPVYVTLSGWNFSNSNGQQIHITTHIGSGTGGAQVYLEHKQGTFGAVAAFGSVVNNLVSGGASELAWWLDTTNSIIYLRLTMSTSGNDWRSTLIEVANAPAISSSTSTTEPAGATWTALPSSAVLVSRDAAETLSNKTLSSPTFSGAYSFGGTPTWPTFNQNTTGSAATLTTSRTIQTNLASTASASFNGSANITPGVTGTLPVGNGGTGATTLTGLVKGNGTGAMTAAVAGTDYVTPSGSEALSGKTLTSPVINGTVSGTAVSTATTANTLALRDANGNLSANALLPGFTATATAAGTTTLTITSDQVQVFTGSSTQTVRLPTTSVVAGGQYRVINNSTGSVTVQSSAGNQITILAANTSGLFMATQATPTANTHWDGQYWGTNVAASKTLAVSNTLTLAGTDGTTMTFPNASGTVVTAAASQALTNKDLTGTGNTFNATNLTTGTLPDARMTGTYSGFTHKIDGANTVFTTPSSGSTNNLGRTVYGLAEYRGNTATITGAIVFFAPTTSSGIMMQLEVSGLLYSQNVVDMIVQGYRNSTTSWSDTRKISTGSVDVDARWAQDPSGNSCLILGDVGSTWNYPHFSITRAMFSHTSTTDAYCTGWTVGLVTDLSAYTNVSSIISNLSTVGNITGSAATLTSTRTLQTNLASTTAANFNGSANASIGVTGTLPVANGGTGRATSTTPYGIIAAGTGATTAQQTIAPGTAGQFLKSAGASTLASFASITATDISDSTATGRSVLTATDAAAARTAIGAGTGNGDVTLTGAQSLTNKTISGNSNTISVADANFTIQDDVDGTKTAKFSLGGLSTGTAITLNAPNVGAGTHTLLSRNSGDTVTNKRIQPRTLSITSSATPSVDTDEYDFVMITALATNITSMTTNLVGAPENGEKLMFRIKDNGTPRSISWGASFQASGVATPLTATSAGKEHHILFVYSATVAKWVCLAVDSVGY